MVHQAVYWLTSVEFIIELALHPGLVVQHRFPLQAGSIASIAKSWGPSHLLDPRGVLILRQGSISLSRWVTVFVLWQLCRWQCPRGCGWRQIISAWRSIVIEVGGDGYTLRLVLMMKAFGDKLRPVSSSPDPRTLSPSKRRRRSGETETYRFGLASLLLRASIWIEGHAEGARLPAFLLELFLRIL
jgi:hypothetical protein